jgi:phage tail sheath protein FI
VTHPAVPIRWRESDVLLDRHINPILTQPSRGVVIWGARTLSRDPKWMHINSRRIVSMISEQLRRDSEWVVFEHQRPELWEIVKRQVRSRLDLLWGAGLLTGEKAGLEYEVQCDAQLNPPEVRDAGQVHVRVLIRPIQTAEFIVVELRLGA